MKKKRKIKKSIKFIFTFIMLISITITSYFLISKDDNKFNFNKIVNENKVTYPIIKKISLVATGDALLHNPVYLSAYDKETDTFNFAPQLEIEALFSVLN